MGFQNANNDGALRLSYETVAAAGTNQATATALAAGKSFHYVTGANSSGVILPAVVGLLSSAGQRDEGVAHIVHNGATNALTVYPDTGGSIGTNAANASIALAASSAAIFVCRGFVGTGTAGAWVGGKFVSGM